MNWKKGERHSIRVQWLPDGVRNIWVDGIPRAQCKGEALFVSVEPEDITNAEQIIGEGSFRLERFRSASHAARAKKILDLPFDVTPVSFLSVGYPAELRDHTGRLPLEEILTFLR